ncbi:putative Mitochondrial carrier protein [Trypanosoma vivax]|uniref:Putative mitochondrial carrier protein n=1 Tax=Trypanosoma vivax (strain Y486) TaxID=1055687 RepID=G0U1G8_TRYVY|nr:putative carrier protein [Trypanosoma vivax]KAH8608893.1 putative Mitochondrial carrier protein [Trypanosoma vivax]CCC49924.1 putative mitochondrial carrier protein [Trypanosoma vivax Y486]
MVPDVCHTLIAGIVSGVAGTVIEYPLDTLKVRLQTCGGRYSGYWNCARIVVREEGARALYNGVSMRFIGSAIEHAVIFSSYKWTLRAIGADELHPNMEQIAVGGIGGGVVSTLFITPLELVKCRMQVGKVTARCGRQVWGVWNCALEIVREGGPTALYRGCFATLAREVPGTAAYCGTYDKMKEMLIPVGGTAEDLSAWHFMLAGGTSGVAFWSIFFPADVVKTRVQVDPTFARSGFFKALRQLYLEGGVHALYCGWTGTVVRAFPSNAIIFSMYDLTMRLLRGQLFA